MNSMKLMPRRLGPYKIIRQFKNDVLVRHMATMEELEYHVDELLLFIGSEEEAKENDFFASACAFLTLKVRTVAQTLDSTKNSYE